MLLYVACALLKHTSHSQDARVASDRSTKRVWRVDCRVVQRGVHVAVTQLYHTAFVRDRAIRARDPRDASPLPVESRSSREPDRGGRGPPPRLTCYQTAPLSARIAPAADFKSVVGALVFAQPGPARPDARNLRPPLTLFCQ